MSQHIDVMTTDGKICNHRALTRNPSKARAILEKRGVDLSTVTLFDAVEEGDGIYRIYWYAAR